MKKKLLSYLCLALLLNSVLASPLSVIVDDLAKQATTTQAVAAATDYLSLTQTSQTIEKVDNGSVTYQMSFKVAGAYLDLVKQEDIALTGVFQDATIDQFEMTNPSNFTITFSHKGTPKTSDKTGSISILRNLCYHPQFIRMSQTVSCAITDIYDLSTDPTPPAPTPTPAPEPAPEPIPTTLTNLKVNGKKINDDGTLPDEATELSGDITLTGDRGDADYTFSTNGTINKVPDVDLKDGFYSAYPSYEIDETDNRTLHFDLTQLNLSDEKTAELIIPASDNVYHQEIKISFDIEHLKATPTISTDHKVNLVITDGVKNESSFAKNLTASDFGLEDAAKDAKLTDIVRAADKKSVAFTINPLDRTVATTTIKLQPAIAYSNGYLSQKVLSGTVATPDYVDPTLLTAKLSLTSQSVEKVVNNTVTYRLAFALTGTQTTADFSSEDISLTGAFQDATIDKVEHSENTLILTVSHKGTQKLAAKTGGISILRHLVYVPQDIPVNKVVSCNLTDTYDVPEVSYDGGKLHLDTPSQDTETPQYTWTLTATNGTFGSNAAANIRYEGGFENAVTQSVTSSGNTLKVVFTKLPDKRVNRNTDGKISLVSAKVNDVTGEEQSLSQSFAVHDDFVPAITYDTTNGDYSPSTLTGEDGWTLSKTIIKEAAKNIGEFGKEFLKCPALKCLVFGESICGLIDMFIKLSKDKEPDPVLEAINQLSEQITALSNQLKNDTDFIVDQQQRARFEARLMAFSTLKNSLFNETNINKLKNVNLAIVENNQDNLSEGQAKIDQQYLRNLYHSDYIDESGNLHEANTAFIDTYKQFALAMTGENESTNSLGDIFTVYKNFNSFAYCFNTETFERREQFNTYYQNLFKMTYAPLIYAVQYDLTDLQSQKVSLQNEKAFLTDKLSRPITETDKSIVQKQIADNIEPRLIRIDESIKRDKQYLGVKNAETSEEVTTADADVSDSAASLGSDQSIRLLENANRTSKEAKQANDDLATEEQEASTSNGPAAKIIAYTLGSMKISGVLGLSSTRDFAVRSIDYSSGYDVQNRMTHDDVVKLINAASKHYADDGVTKLNLRKELLLGGFFFEGNPGFTRVTQDDLNNFVLFTNKSRETKEKGWYFMFQVNRYTDYTNILLSDNVTEKEVKAAFYETMIGSSDLNSKKTVLDKTLGIYLSYRH
ncbi:MAG: hypothetical protein LBS41_03425 [Streptococcaceae bacterium]|nr:hypothetical protein [Streptococcaceae bacterium]